MDLFKVKCWVLLYISSTNISLKWWQLGSAAEGENVQSDGWNCLTRSPQWSTSNWRNSQRWLSPRAAARASTPHTALTQPVSSPPTACLSVATVSTHGTLPSEQRTRLFVFLFFLFCLLPYPHPPTPSVPTQWLFRVTVWMCITVLKPIIWRKKKWLKSKTLKNKEYVKRCVQTFTSCMALYMIADWHN